MSKRFKRILENDLAEVYFNKDQEGLVKILNRVYGEDFFSNNQLVFEYIHFSSDTEEIIELANEVMAENGGEPLVEEDVTTSYSAY